MLIILRHLPLKKSKQDMLTQKNNILHLEERKETKKEEEKNLKINPNPFFYLVYIIFFPLSSLPFTLSLSHCGGFSGISLPLLR